MEAIQEGHLHFPSPEWDQVSGEALELVCSLLERDATRRISAAEVVNHDWMYCVGAVASDPIPLMSRHSSLLTSTRNKGSGSRSGRLVSEQRDEDSSNDNGRHENGGASCFSPPDTERHRLGTEDSGFGGDTVVSNVIGMLMDAANEDCDFGIMSSSERSRDVFGNSVSESADGFYSENNGTLVHVDQSSRGRRKRGGAARLGSEVSGDQHLFEMSDEESLFSSGYGVSLDMQTSGFVMNGQSSVEFGNGVPSTSSGKAGNSVQTALLQKTPSSETDFGFERVNKSEIESEMRKAATGSEPTKAALLTSLGLRRSKEEEYPRKNSDGMTALSSNLHNGCHISREPLRSGCESGRSIGAMKKEQRQQLFGLCKSKAANVEDSDCN